MLMGLCLTQFPCERKMVIVVWAIGHRRYIYENFSEQLVENDDASCQAKKVIQFGKLYNGALK
ncbi:hypothetical protein JCM39068_22740 [Desulfocastanea catecholica]